MPYEIYEAAPARKALDKLARQQPADAAAIEDVIESLGDDPRPAGCSLLKGYRGVWRVRMGNYRICYTVDDGKLVVLVITISTRDDVYEVLRRYLGR